MLIDDVKIKISAGAGGKGGVSFNTNLKSLGPTGVSGGKGGSVYAEGVSDISALNQFRYKKEIKAENGAPSGRQFRDGKDGADLLLKLPIGTVIHNLTNGSELEIKKTGEKVFLAKGGIGGRGNFHFRSSRNTTPMESQGGRPGESFEFRLELKLIADVGFVGLPNAGKSSMLNELTNAQSKVANYAFTTLEPNLGAYYELILADIPGLIEGSSIGKGLGTKFLRHIERTRILFHFVAAESENVGRDYKIIRNELKKYSKELAAKKEYLFLSKYDMILEKELKKKLTVLKKLNKNVIVISIHDEGAIQKIKEILNDIQLKK